MKRIIVGLAFWILACAGADAQNVVPIVNGAPVSTGNPMPIIGSISATTSATAAATLSSGLTPGSNAIYESLGGGLYVQPVFGSASGSGTQVDATHGLPVNIVAGAGSGGTAIADGATFTEASTSFTPIGGEYVSGGGANCTTGKGCTVQMTIDRMAYVNIGKVGGAATGTAGSAGTGVLTVQGIASMTPLLINPGTIATWGLATVGAGSAPTNALVGGAIYNSTPITVTNTQSAALQSDANGFLKVNVAASVAPAGIAQGATYSAQTFTPVMGLASTNAPTATNGDLWALSISPSSGGVRIDLKDSASNTNAFLVTGTGGTFPVTGTFYQATQPVSIASGQVVSGAFATGAMVDLLTFQGSKAPGTAAANSLLAGGEYVSAGVTLTTGQQAALQLDASGNLNVNIKAGAGSGGTAIADGATFTEASTSFTPVGGEYVSGGGASCTTGKGCTVQMTIDRMAYVNIGKVGGAATGTAGSAGTGVLTVQGIASMTPISVSIASGGIASGAIAAGAVSAGAFVSGSVLSGAYASGSLASGAVVDITNGTDTAYAGSGSTSLDGYLKGIYNGITSAVPSQAVKVPIGGVGLCDGGNGATNPCTTAATVKAASTAAAATDTSVVVQINSAEQPNVPVFNGANFYVTIAASQTAQVLQSSTGATGDYLSHCTIVPATTAPGVVTILDNSTAIYSYPGGGTTALLTLVPFTIPVGAKSVSGAWKVTTGANVSVVCVGKFS
jgi:hypothetical protein